MVKPVRVAVVVVVLTLVVGAYATNTTTTGKPYVPLTNRGIYFYDPSISSTHPMDVNLSSAGRSIIFIIQNHGNDQDHSAGAELDIGSFLIFNGTVYARYGWPCDPNSGLRSEDPHNCATRPGPARYFVFAGWSKTPDVNWSRDDTGNGPYYAEPLSGGGSGGVMETPLSYNWVPGHLYQILVQRTDGTTFSKTLDGIGTTVNAPATDPSLYCADYACSNPTTTTTATP